MNPKVIYEDEFIMVLDKPWGWVTNEAKTVGKNPVIQSFLKKNFDYPLAKDFEKRFGIVHRLDKETSGVLLVAKTKENFENLQLQFKRRVVSKVYIALVHGKVVPKEGKINAPIARLPWRRERFGILASGKKAKTFYKVISYYKLKNSKDKNKPFELFTLLEVYPLTGRTHQIRVHLKYLGYPIVSDSVYAGRKTLRKDKNLCPRLFLHAKKISFTHPFSKNKVSFTSELPNELKKVLSLLEKVQ